MKPEDVPKELAEAFWQAPPADAGPQRTILAHVLPMHERMVREQVAAEIRAYAAGLHSASEPTWYGGMADAAELAAGVDPQELHRRNAQAAKIRRGQR